MGYVPNWQTSGLLTGLVAYWRGMWPHEGAHTQSYCACGSLTLQFCGWGNSALMCLSCPRFWEGNIVSPCSFHQQKQLCTHTCTHVSRLAQTTQQVDIMQKRMMLELSCSLCIKATSSHQNYMYTVINFEWLDHWFKVLCSSPEWYTGIFAHFACVYSVEDGV